MDLPFPTQGIPFVGQRLKLECSRQDGIDEQPGFGNLLLFLTSAPRSLTETLTIGSSASIDRHP